MFTVTVTVFSAVGEPSFHDDVHHSLYVVVTDGVAEKLPLAPQFELGVMDAEPPPAKR